MNYFFITDNRIVFITVARYNIDMTLKELLKSKNLTIYSLSKKTHIPKSTLADIFSRKSNIYDCRVGTIYQIARALDVSIDDLLDCDLIETNPYYEENIPQFLKDGIEKLKNKESSIYDAYLDEVNSSINVCEVESIITHDHANYLRKKYLY